MVSSRLTCDKDSNSADCFQLGLACADMCNHLKWMIDEVELDNLSLPSRQAIGGLTTWVNQCHTV